jgi:hypothetical protein
VLDRLVEALPEAWPWSIVLWQTFLQANITGLKYFSHATTTKCGAIEPGAYLDLCSIVALLASLIQSPIND